MSEAWKFFDKIFDCVLDAMHCDDDIIVDVLKFIYSYVKAQIFKTENARPKKAAADVYKHDAYKIDICMQNILKIKDLLENTEESRDEFLRIFPVWKRYRMENVDGLNKIAKALHDEKKIINAVKVIGSAVGVAAGAAILTSIFFPPVAAVVTTIPSWLGGSILGSLLPSLFRKAPVPVTSMAAIVGGALAATSGVSHLGTALTEVILLEKHIEETLNILEEDKKAFEFISKWLKHTEEFTDAMESLCSKNVWKIVLEDLQAFITLFNNLNSKWECNEIISKLKHLMSNCSRKIDLLDMYSPAYTIALVGLLFTIFLIYRKNRVLFSCILATFNLFTAYEVIMDAGLQTAPGVAAMTTTGAMAGVKRAPEVVLRDTAIGVFAGLGMALDAASLILTTIDISKGSVSEPGKQIEDVSKNLSEELKVLEEVNNELVGSKRRDYW